MDEAVPRSQKHSLALHSPLQKKSLFFCFVLKDLGVYGYVRPKKTQKVLGLWAVILVARAQSEC